eukprot:TRINITY_DN6771_c0_g4_i1.p1 TRINITY_DN6771_c0_g4~~TRINITY_DN6771_c0_g4_i1.p1  ORF type:complete len:250 (+),score=59.09 TRINITY_DN6771_c0_g4_i1:66-752(+)
MSALARNNNVVGTHAASHTLPDGRTLSYTRYVMSDGTEEVHMQQGTLQDLASFQQASHRQAQPVPNNVHRHNSNNFAYAHAGPLGHVAFANNMEDPYVFHQRQMQQHELIMQQHHQRIAAMQQAFQHVNMQQPIYEQHGQYVQQAAFGHEGSSEQDIDNLPTFFYRQRDSDASPGESDASCAICLSDYHDNDELRTLPCFHKFHKDCIDRSLRMSSKCPLCQHSIDGN